MFSCTRGRLSLLLLLARSQACHHVIEGEWGWGLAPMLSLYIHFEIEQDGKKDFP